MTAPSPGAGLPLTMSSHLVAELTGVRHSRVLVLVRAMCASQGLDASRYFSVSVSPHGRELARFDLPRREALILATGFEPVAAVNIIDWWEDVTAAPFPMEGEADGAGCAVRGLCRLMARARARLWSDWRGQRS